MLFFSGFGLGTFLAGLFSDAFGRKVNRKPGCDELQKLLS
jgi:hypothetical protein